MQREKVIKKESFMQGVLALMISQVLIKLLGFVYKSYLTNKEGFGDTGNAIYNSGYQIYALLLTLSSIGVPNAVSKLVSAKVSLGDYKGAHRIFKISLITFGLIGLVATSILFFGAGYIANNFLQIPEAEMTLVALSPAIFFVAIISVIRGFFNGRASIKVTAKSQSLEQLFKTVFTIIIVELIAISSGVNATVMAAGANLATTLATVTSFIYLFSYYRMQKQEIENELQESIKTEEKTAWQIVKNIMFVSIPMSLSSILASINKNIDSFTVVRFLKKIMTEAEAKVQYGILSGKVDILTTLPLSFNIAFATALVPAISSAKVKGDMKTGIKRISFSLLTTMLIGLPCTIGLIVFAEPILKLLFPNAPAGAFMLQISAIAIIFTALEQTVNGALQGLGKVFIPAIALVFGVIVKCVLNVILIQLSPEQCIIGGAIGAAFATAMCHIIAFSIGFIVLCKNVDLKLSFLKTIVKPVLATIIMSIVSYGSYIFLMSIIAERWAIIISLIIAVIIYVISIIILNIFSKEEWAMIPYGSKIYKFFEKIGIYKIKQIQ